MSEAPWISKDYFRGAASIIKQKKKVGMKAIWD